MSDNGKGPRGVTDGKEEPHVDPKDLSTDPMKLLQLQVVDQMTLVQELVLTLRSLPTGAPGGDGGGDSDPDSSDSQELDGTPKTRGPKYFAHNKKKMQRAIKRISPPQHSKENLERDQKHTS